MPKTVSAGKCRLCGQLLGRGQMTSHLKTCAKRTAATSAPATTPKAARCFHIVVEATYAPDYWLYLEVPANATFGQLDGVLRDIWLECCGHMSAFRFPEKRPRQTFAPADFAQLLAELAQRDFEDEMDEEQRLMGVQVGKRFCPGLKLNYEYDFGSTTHLTVRVLDERPCFLPKPKIRLLARNEPPNVRCASCGKPATQICTECNARGEDGALCDACTTDHECGKDMLLPVVNSPRTGVCGYCGPSVEP